MLDHLAWLSLEVLYADRATAFYEAAFDLEPTREGETTVFPIGDQELRLVEPGPVPRGGLHVHYAMATPPARYDDWYERLDGAYDLVEHEFGSSRSLYLDDPDGHCVEIGGVGDPASGADLTGIFEVVLEVEDLERSERFYTDLGFSVVDRGADRPRVRLSGPVDLELWEPQRGLADARGGVHVDLGFDGRGDDLPEGVADLALVVEDVETGTRLRDPDGHAVTIREA
ncbi:MAG: VOC family protein [Halanaeroarchaeum sp.]